MAAKSKAKTAKKTVKTNGTVKNEQIIKLMRRTNGVTRAEVLELTGWAAVSMQQQAKAAGVRLKIDKSARPFRYRCNGD